MPKYLKKHLLLIIAGLTLFAALSMSSCENMAATKSELPAGQIALLKNGKEFAIVQVSSIGSAEVNASFRKKGGAVEDHVYQVTELNDVLKAEGISGLPEGSNVVITAKDGFAATFTADEVQKPAAIYLASRIDRQPIAGSDGKSAVMLVVPGDAFSNRWVSDVLSIDLISGS